MSNKLPFKISFYLDTRYEIYDRLKHDDPFTLKSQGNFRSDRSKRHSLYIVVYSRLERKKKLYKVETMSEKTWNDITTLNAFSSKAKDMRSIDITQRAMNLAKEKERFDSCNGIKGVVTIEQFHKELNKGVNHVSQKDSLLSRLWLGYWADVSKATETHTTASQLSIFSFINDSKENRGLGKHAGSFLIQDVDKKFIEKYIEWYTSKPKHNSRNSAISYLTDLRTIINYAIRLGVLDKEQNPFGKKNEGKYMLPKKNTRSKQYTLSPKQLSDFLNATPKNDNQQKARDIFALLFLMNGIRIIDLIRLRKQDVKETQGQKYYEILAKKTDGSNKVVEVAITPQIEELISRYPGEGDYVLDILPPDLPYRESNRIGRNKYRKLVEHLKAFSSSVEGVPSISWSYTRFSANNFLHVNSYASRSLIAEMQGNTYQVNQGYSHDVNFDKFKVQERLNEVFVNSEKQKSLGKKDIKKKENETTS